MNIGWIRVKSSGALGASMIYRRMDSSGAGDTAVSEAGIMPSVPATQFFFTVDTRKNYSTGLAVVNPNQAALAVRYALYGNNGKLRAKVSQKLNGFSHSTRMIGEIFPDQDLTDFTGMVTAFSSGETMVATTLRSNENATTLAGIPVTTEFPMAGGEYAAGDLYTVDSIVENLRYIPAGTYFQGVRSYEPGQFWDETPRFRHTLTKNLVVMETEVTRQMWKNLRALQSSLPADPTVQDFGAGMSHPVQNISWYEAVLFANLLSVQQGLTRVYYLDGTFTVPLNYGNYRTGEIHADWNANGYRLPTEGEWEYFARAGTITPFSVNEPGYFHWTQGSCNAEVLPVLEGVAWYCANAGNATHPVGSKAANSWGLKDVHGNVQEFCWDWYSYYTGETWTDYRGPSSGSYRTLRGGSYDTLPFLLRSATRNYLPPGFYFSTTGFRLVRSLN